MLMIWRSAERPVMGLEDDDPSDQFCFKRQQDAAALSFHGSLPLLHITDVLSTFFVLVTKHHCVAESAQDCSLFREVSTATRSSLRLAHLLN